jgi:hypothetical protein
VTAAPDLAAPIAGWRVWRLEKDEGGPVLASPMKPLAWAPRRAATASCAAGCAGPPGWDCHCGLYALADLADLAGLATDHVSTVIGCTALWGRVVEATNGWRAERAYPLVLFVHRVDRAVPTRMLAAALRLGTVIPDELLGGSRADVCRALGDRYGVPVHELPSTRQDPLHPGDPSVRQSRRWRGTYADVVADRPSRALADAAEVLRGEAGQGLAARRLGDREARRRFEGAVARLVATLQPEPPPV